MTVSSRQNATIWIVWYLSAVSAISRTHSSIMTSPRYLIRPISKNCVASILATRGGSTATEAPGNDSETDTAKEEIEGIDVDDEGLEENEEDEKVGTEISSEPARLLVQTNLGNSVLDHRLEVTSRRSKTIGELKISISRLLPSRPPILGLQLVYNGRVVEDDMLINEIYGDDEDDEEEDDEVGDGDIQGSFKVLTLNSLSPVDPRFGVGLAPKLKPHLENDDGTLTTEEILDAYFLNAATMALNSHLLNDPKAGYSPLLRVEIQEHAKQLKERFRSEVSDDAWEKSLQAVKHDHNMEEIRGQRHRSGKGGARTSLKKSLQTNLNINWNETIRNFLLLLFFGFFGGKNSFSRTVMLWGAPMCFLLQARPAKMWSKIIFYMLSNPPGIVSSLLPAPEQAILNANLEKSYTILYRPDEVEKEKAKSTRSGPSSNLKEEKQHDDKDNDEVIQEYDSEDESEEEDSDDEEDDDDSDDE